MSNPAFKFDHMHIIGENSKASVEYYALGIRRRDLPQRVFGISKPAPRSMWRTSVLMSWSAAPSNIKCL